MDPEMGRFLSPDPMGYVDGPSEYALASLNPIQRGDPFGLYQADFHYGITFLLSNRAGFSRLVSQRIAAATERPDQDGRSPVLSGVMARMGRAVDRAQLLEWHFPKESMNSPAVSPGSSYAWLKVKAGIASRNLEQFGEGLHPLQDSWSHQGIPSMKGGYAGHPEARGGLLSAQADIPSEFPDDALAASEATYRALLAFREKGCQPGDIEREPVPWATVEVELREFVAIQERKDKRDWFAGRGVSMPEAYWDDVSRGPVEQEEVDRTRAQTRAFP